MEGDLSFAAIRSQAKANGVDLATGPAGRLYEPHVCARTLGHAFIPWVVAPPACLFRRGLCGCPDAGGGPGWLRSGVLYSGPNRSVYASDIASDRARNLMFITVARGVGSRRGGLCLGSCILGGTDIAGRGRTPEMLYVTQDCRRIYAGRISLASDFEP